MITGGHLTPALATIEEMQRIHPEWAIVFVGRKVAIEGSATQSEEYRIITGLGLPFLPISAGRLKRDGGISALWSLFKIPMGFVTAARFVLREKPSLILSFGGYIALPVVWWAWVLKIPIVTHEQTTRPGLANQIIARLATNICVSFPQAAALLGRNERTEVTGLPMRREVFMVPKENPFGNPFTPPVLLVVGGSTGSTSINDVVFASLSTLLSEYTLIHQVGRVSLAKAEKIHEFLDTQLKSRYVPMAYLSADAYSFALHNATIIIGRSGANTVTEIAVAGKTAIFIPLPWAANNEQYHNAVVLKDAGSSVILEQKNLSVATLTDTIRKVAGELEDRQQKAKRFAEKIPHDGAFRLVTVIDRILSK